MIAVERLGGSGVPVVLLLHAGVADRRSWRDLAPHLGAAAYAYDRRGFGDTPPSAQPFRHLDDLLSVLEGLGSAPAWLVGNSMGGGLAIDAALTAPERVAGLVLVAPAVSGAPDPGDHELDADTLRVAEDAGASGLDAWSRLERIPVPTTVVWGALDIPFLRARYATVAARIPGARTEVMDGVAHLPGLERPRELAALVNAAIA